MTKLQSWTMAGLAAVALAVAALMATGAISFAQEGDSTATPTPSATATPESSDDAATPEATAEPQDEDSSEGDRAGCHGGKGLIKDAAAEVLGLSEADLRDALDSGQTLAEVAEAQGMNVDDFKAAIIENVTADLQAKLDAGDITQEEFDDAISELPDKVDTVVNAEGGLRFRGGSSAGTGL